MIGQPDIDFIDPDASFCAATWTYGITVVTSRSNDRDAQTEMSRLLLDIVQALSATQPPGVFSVEALDARPIPVQVSGQELPGYLLTVRVRA